MIIVAGGGKSTIATNLAIMRAQRGHDVLLVDADDQETAADFTVLRNATVQGGAGYTCIKLTGPAVRTEIERIAPKTGSVGVLIQARMNGVIAELKPLLDQLIAAGFYLDPNGSVYRDALRSVGENTQSHP